MDGVDAEFQRRPEDARLLYQRAWDNAQDDYERCVAAHYMARFQPAPEEALRWNQIALAHAEMVNDERVTAFYPSLYVNLGRSHELLGDEAKAQHYYELAAALGLVHQQDGPPNRPHEWDDN